VHSCRLCIVLLLVVQFEFEFFKFELNWFESIAKERKKKNLFQPKPATWPSSSSFSFLPRWPIHPASRPSTPFSRPSLAVLSISFSLSAADRWGPPVRASFFLPLAPRLCSWTRDRAPWLRCEPPSELAGPEPPLQPLRACVLTRTRCPYLAPDPDSGPSPAGARRRGSLGPHAKAAFSPL
jgi:hypothetical protein